MFESIKSIRPHFHSLREIDANVSLDIKLPLNWKMEEIVKPYRSLKFRIQDKNEKTSLVSLIANATPEGYEVVFACALDIITINKEEEEKEKLFQQKVKELQELFKKESLHKLKDINLLTEYGKGFEIEGIGLVEEADGEGPEGDREPQK